MLVSIEWLKDFVDIDCSPEELQEKLVRSGFEIEDIIKTGENCKNVVVGRIETLEKHPDADKLQICSINVGGSENVQIVTGADNVSVGDLVPVAMDNSNLPNGMHIKKGKLRGVMSYGMLCSGGELCLTESDYKGAEVDGIMILNGDIALGTDINKVIGNDDIILDVGVTANRPDCNSVLGIAREVAAALNKTLRMPKIGYKTDKATKISDYLKVNVINNETCPRYMAQVVKDIVIKESPSFIKKRLKSVGIRSINNIVDITNYVLTEIGQPMHAFDYTCIKSGVINVRNAKNGESIVALDEKKYQLDETMLVIADGEEPSAIAGVMGGEHSGIKDSTNTVVFESAKFARDSIRRTSRKLNLKSDSSSRYERGIDFMSQQLGLERALTLIAETESGVIVDGTIDECSGKLSLDTVTVSAAKINSILGIEIEAEEMARILNSLEIKTVLDKNGMLTCNPPLFRDDIENANDIAEEIIRLYGYDNISSTLLDTAVTAVPANTENKRLNAIKSVLTANGLNETLTYSFTSPKIFDALNMPQDSKLRKTPVLLNPMGEDFSVMRSTLVYSMLDVMAKNIKRSNKDLRLFEIAHVYFTDETPMIELPKEEMRIVIGVSGKNEDFYTLKGIIESLIEFIGVKANYVRSNVPYLHSGISADIVVNGENIGHFGEVHPNVLQNIEVKDKLYVAELNYEAIYRLFNYDYEFKEIPKYPSMERDIAIVVDDAVTAEEILNVVRQVGGKLLVDSSIFDVYKGKGIENGKKSIAVNMQFNSLERTLVEDEVNTRLNKIIKRLKESLNAELR